MQQFRFVGSMADIGTRTLDRFGEQIELDAKDAAALIEQRVPLIPEELWQQAGITEKECAEWFSVELHTGAPKDFLEKRAQVWELLHQYRTPKES